ncbi:Hypothetical protein OINT_2000005 [Brucella intermedia LMG 3301]|uniref:Uncharacterized protein n=1 Tax=Brucella intermedia LMG 3301 TaxID=641118 RepID=C4WKV7_9HYPH|nr:Hypothetical protein OINT_2000005 [Brucella intermedia LMG 3301]
MQVVGKRSMRHTRSRVLLAYDSLPEGYFGRSMPDSEKLDQAAS